MKQDLLKITYMWQLPVIWLLSTIGAIVLKEPSVYIAPAIVSVLWFIVLVVVIWGEYETR